jgi:hypothetical protein
MELEPTLTGRYRAKVKGVDRAKRKSRLSSLVQAVFVIAAFLLTARSVTVLVLSFREEPVFTAPKTIYLPQRELEHQMAVAEFQNAAATPATIPALTTESLLATMPALPQIPNVDFKPVENEAMVSESDALFGQSGLMGALGQLSSQASSISFMGIQDEATRFVIIADVSGSPQFASRAANVDFRTIGDDAVKLVESLNSNTLFGLVMHSRGYKLFNNQLVAATISSKVDATTWLRSIFDKYDPSVDPKKYQNILGSSQTGANGTNGIVTILDTVFDMQPDAIFMVSDGGYFTNNNRSNTAKDTSSGSFGRPVELKEVLGLIRDRQRDLPSDARIHTIHFSDPRSPNDERIGSGMRSIASRNGGKYRKIGR